LYWRGVLCAVRGTATLVLEVDLLTPLAWLGEAAEPSLRRHAAERRRT
jgi:hypothetical protein